MCWLPSAHSRQVFLKRFEFKMAYVLSQMFGVWNGTGVTNFLLRKRRIDTLQARLSPVRFFSKCYIVRTVFENHSKCRIRIYVQPKVTCLVTLFDRKFQVFKNLPKLTFFLALLMLNETFSVILKHRA